MLKSINYEGIEEISGISINKLCNIITELKKYSEEKKLIMSSLLSVEDNSDQDKKNDRYDIEIAYKAYDDNGMHYNIEKLLFLQGKIIDAKTFHRKIRDFYTPSMLGIKCEYK